MTVNKAFLASILIASWVGLGGCGSNNELDLTSPSFEEGDAIPEVHTADGDDMSPALEWNDPPADTKSFALICEDPDAPFGTFIHWVMYDIPASTRELPLGIPDSLQFADGTKQGHNSFTVTGYRGPSPPPGKPHRYFFRLYALDTMLGLPPGVTNDDLSVAMKGRVLAEGRLMGIYGR